MESAVMSWVISIGRRGSSMLIGSAVNRWITLSFSALANVIPKSHRPSIFTMRAYTQRLTKRWSLPGSSRNRLMMPKRLVPGTSGRFSFTSWQRRIVCKIGCIMRGDYGPRRFGESYFDFGGRFSLVHRTPWDLSVNNAHAMDKPMGISFRFRGVVRVSREWSHGRLPVTFPLNRNRRSPEHGVMKLEGGRPNGKNFIAGLFAHVVSSLPSAGGRSSPSLQCELQREPRGNPLRCDARP